LYLLEQHSHSKFGQQLLGLTLRVLIRDYEIGPRTLILRYIELIPGYDIYLNFLHFLYELTYDRL